MTAPSRVLFSRAAWKVKVAPVPPPHDHDMIDVKPWAFRERGADTGIDCLHHGRGVEIRGQIWPRVAGIGGEMAVIDIDCQHQVTFGGQAVRLRLGEVVHSIGIRHQHNSDRGRSVGNGEVGEIVRAESHPNGPSCPVGLAGEASPFFAISGAAVKQD